MENEIVKREDQSFIERLIINADNLEQIKEVGMVIIKSGFCPQHFKDSQDAVGAIMCIEAGKKIGLTWMQSLSDIYPVRGRIGIMGTAAKAVIFASGVLESWHEYTEGEYPNPEYKHITVSKRKDLPNEFRTEFSVFDASTAGLMQKDIYKRYGKRMIAWRDIGFHASDYYQDILKGMKTIEELNDFDVIPGVGDTTIEKEDGTKINITGGSKGKSTKMTERVADKIKTEGFAPVQTNVRDAVVVNEDTVNVPDPPPVEGKNEPPSMANRGIVETFDGKEIARDEPKEEVPGQYTLKGMEGMDPEVLKKIVMEDLDMMEASEILSGKNTNKKLRFIIDAAQRGKLQEYVEEQLAKAVKESEEPPVDTARGEIAPNKAFDQQKPEAKQQDIDNFLDDPIKKDEPKAGNKYDIEISEDIPRDFSQTKTLFNRLLMIAPRIDNNRYLELAGKKNILAAFLDKETFLKNATKKMVDEILDSN